MDVELLKLLDAQENDIELDKLIKSQKEYPASMAALKQEIELLEKELEETEKQLLQAEMNRRLYEEEIAAERENLARKEKRLLETKTNKEYGAVNSEIIQARERIDKLETQELEAITLLEELGPKKTGLAEKLETVSKENNEKIREIKGKFDSIEVDAEKLRHKTKVILASVDPKILSVYNRLRKGKGGIAVAIVDPVRLSCRGCFKQLPPQKVLEVRRANRLLFCESCGRILVWDTRKEG
jgi:predicted  nucleic acid-binding Zn-ribbon protein